MSTTPAEVSWPKWPALLVDGKKVTQLQAYEIIIRTTSGYLSCNDKAWEDLCRKIMGLPKHVWGAPHRPEFWEQEQAAWKALGHIDLEYLDNDRIMSCWIGGSKGWVDWNGRIFTANYNIGKWPSMEEVRQDWIKIAKAFPFLDLTSQLMSGETCEEGIVPIAEFRIKDGKVRSRKPGKVICGGPTDTGIALCHTGLSLIQERGCSEEQLKAAVKHVRSIMGRAL